MHSFEPDAKSIAAAFDDDFCYLIPPRPMAGIFEPDATAARTLSHDNGLARALEGPLRRAVERPIVTLAPSHPFDGESPSVVEPGLQRVLLPMLWLYAEYWAAARLAVLDGEAGAFAATPLAPLRKACAAAVVFVVFGDRQGGIEGAAWLSLLTGSVLVRWP